MFTLIPSAPNEIQLNFVKSCLALAPGGPQMGTRMLDGRRGLFRSYALYDMENKKGGQRDPERDCHGHLGQNPHASTSIDHFQCKEKYGLYCDLAYDVVQILDTLSGQILDAQNCLKSELLSVRISSIQISDSHCNCCL